jgi:hypothetical protein
MLAFWSGRAGELNEQRSVSGEDSGSPGGQPEGAAMTITAAVTSPGSGPLTDGFAFLTNG